MCGIRQTSLMKMLGAPLSKENKGVEITDVYWFLCERIFWREELTEWCPITLLAKRDVTWRITDRCFNEKGPGFLFAVITISRGATTISISPIGGDGWPRVSGDGAGDGDGQWYPIVYPKHINNLTDRTMTAANTMVAQQSLNRRNRINNQYSYQYGVRSRHRISSGRTDNAHIYWFDSGQCLMQPTIEDIMQIIQIKR